MTTNKIQFEIERQENVQNGWKSIIPDRLPIQLVSSSDYIQIINSLNSSHQIAQFRFIAFSGLMLLLMISLVVSKFPNIPLIIILCLLAATYSLVMVILHRQHVSSVDKIIFDINSLYTDKQVHFFYKKRGFSIFSIYSLFVEYPDRDYSNFDDNNISVNVMMNNNNNNNNKIINNENNFTSSISQQSQTYEEPKDIFFKSQASTTHGFDHQPLLNNNDDDIDF
ncbi:hypothetical protein CYY_002159 [Polysphondylium violaceum]|uniref:Transmembrane protein n=1 Tax=Polysphondylium violaceum TaxID=133409 RepID=A0A8J4V109_9MYCE|nr:hypothetical protein CYY_002159 [Polysphondylium violaceum]